MDSTDPQLLDTEQAQQAQVQDAQQAVEDQQLPSDVGEENIEDGSDARSEDLENGEPTEEAPPAAEEAPPAAEEALGEGSGGYASQDSADADGADADAYDAEAGANDFEDDIYKMKSHKAEGSGQTRKKKIRKSAREGALASAEAQTPMEMAAYAETDFSNEDPAGRKRRLLEEKMDMAVKSRAVKRRKADEDDLERMQDDRIDLLKNKMIEAANLDVEKNSQGHIATEKLKLLREVMDTLSKADLAISILDNNLLEAVRLWLEPLPDASMPSYQIQKDLLQSLAGLPIKTDHLVASGIGKVLVFYQRSTRTEPNLKKIVDKLIGEWTRPILNKSDSYKDRTIRFNDYNKSKFTNKLASARAKNAEPKTLYEQQAERRNRAAIPSARTTAYKIAPKVDPSLLMRQQRGNGEMFNRINRKMTNSKKKVVKRSGPSVEGKNLSM